ncbi:PQQ-binding-like beta-propeller repeat protein [Mariprofundus ferrinatatus]|nr:PQQ-binding-like beta-propeller repeat protein [Mariprofundus ferrinatatus]
MMKLLLAATALLLSACSTDLFSWGEADTKVEKAEERFVVSAPAEISVAWRADLDQRRPASPSGFSNPAVVQGKSGELIVAGAQDRRVRVFSSHGSEVQRVAMTAAGESGALQLSNGLVVVADVDGMLFGVDINQGSVAWSVELPSALMSRPVPAGNDFVFQTENNQVFRFTAEGKKVWSYSGPASVLGIQYTPSPVVHRDRIYISMKSGDVVALKADSGSFLWQRQLLLSNEAAVLSELKVPAAAPVLIPAEFSGRSEDMLAVPVFQGELFFLSLLDGSTLASRKISTKSSPLHVGKRLYVAGADGALSALDASGGETLWKQRLSSGELVGPILWQQNLWLADEFGMVFRLDLEGKLLASAELDGRIDVAPVASSDGVLVRNNLGTLFKLR